MLGGRDHSTLVHSVNMALSAAQRDPDYAAAVERLASCPDLAEVADLGEFQLVATAARSDDADPAVHPLAGLPCADVGDRGADAIRARRETRQRVEKVLARRTVLRETSALEDDDIDARNRVVASARLLDAILAARAVAA